jgi:GT2 family glycosyltransferase
MTELQCHKSTMIATDFRSFNELASIIIVTYNHHKYLEKCVSSIRKQNYPHEIIVVDNGSTDGTINYIKETFPDIKIIVSPANRGYGAGNNLGFKYTNGRYIVILNPDVIVEQSWLENLIAPLKRQDNVITTSKILMYDGKKINTLGNINHYTGLTFTRGLGEDPIKYSQILQTTGISGACFALTNTAYAKIGGFDETFFLYNEDSDFSWRANLMGYNILAIPDSIIYHDYQLKVSPEKIYFLEKGRYIILRKYLSLKDKIILSPSLFIAEILTFGYAIQFGKVGLKFKLKAMVDGYNARVQYVNREDHTLLFQMLEKSIPIDQLTFTRIDRIVKIFSNYIFKLNMRFIR